MLKMSYKYAHLFSSDGKYFNSIEENKDNIIKEYKNIFVFQNGSNKFDVNSFKNKEIIDSLLTLKESLVIVPNSYEIENRPFYNNPDTLENYEKVLKIREMELDYVLFKLNEINIKNIILIGNSEGSPSVLEHIKYKNIISKKIILAYSCESNYYHIINENNISKDDSKRLIIFGLEDEFFSLKSKYKVNKGNPIDTFQNSLNVKIVLLSNTKHLLFDNPFVKKEIVEFIK